MVMLKNVGILLLLGGCEEVTKETYPNERAHAECKAMRRCYRAEYEGEHEGLEDCGEDLALVIEEEVQLYPDCSFRQEQAQECVNSVQTASCEDFGDDYDEVYEACERVYDCE